MNFRVIVRARGRFVAQTFYTELLTAILGKSWLYMLFCLAHTSLFLGLAWFVAAWLPYALLNFMHKQS